MLRPVYIALVALALIGRATCQDDDDPDYSDADNGHYDDDEDEGGYGGGGDGGGDEGPAQNGAPVELSTVADFDEFLNDADASVIGAFTAPTIVDPSAVTPEGWDEDEDGKWEPPMIDNPAMTSFNEISSSLFGYRFAYTVTTEVLEHLKSKAGGLYLFRSPKFVSAEHGDRPRERFPSTTLSESAVGNWLAAKAQPLVGLYSSATKARYKGAVLVIFMNIDFERNTKSIQYVLKRARKAAAGLKGKLSIALSATANLAYEMDDFGLTSEKLNTDILMGIAADGKHYGSEVRSFSGPALAEFARAFQAGELTPYVKPDPPDEPDQPDQSGDEGMGYDEDDDDDEMEGHDDDLKDEA